MSLGLQKVTEDKARELYDGGTVVRFVVHGDSPISGTYAEFDKNNRFSGATSPDGFNTTIPRNMDFFHFTDLLQELLL